MIGFPWKMQVTSAFRVHNAIRRVQLRKGHEMTALLDKLPMLRPFLRAGRKFAAGALSDVFFKEWKVRPLSVGCTCGFHELGSGEPKPTLERPLVFVYRSGYRALGSVRLRVQQCASAVKAVVHNPELVRVVTEEHPVVASSGGLDIVWSKTALTASSVAAIRKVSERGNRVFLDFVDGSDIPELSTYAHGYMCASRTEVNYRTSRGHQAWYVPHAVDSRIVPQSFDRQEFSVGYFGRPWMVEHVDALPAIQAVPAQESLSDWEFRDSLNVVSGWSHHYSIRSYFGESNFKPPTKVFVAARLGAVFIGSRSDEEVALLLGHEYPYLSKDSGYQEAEKTLDFARETFLGEPWRMASEAMVEARKESCDYAVASAVLSILR